MARYWHRARRFLAQKVLHTDDTPHAIALGTAIAMLVAFLPLIGLQTVIAVGLAALFRANKAVCVPVVWITNPFTMWPIYGACFGLGRFFMAAPNGGDEAVVLSQLQRQQSVGLFDRAFWEGLLSQVGNASVELWVGCTIVGCVMALASYIFSRWGVTTYRERRRRRILRRNLLRSKLPPGQVVRRREPV